MLACDLVLEVRASRVLTAEQVRQLERAVAGVRLDRQELDVLLLIDRYAERADPGWRPLLERTLAQAKEEERRLSAAA